MTGRVGTEEHQRSKQTGTNVIRSRGKEGRKHQKRKEEDWKDGKDLMDAEEKANTNKDGAWMTKNRKRSLKIGRGDKFIRKQLADGNMFAPVKKVRNHSKEVIFQLRLAERQQG